MKIRTEYQSDHQSELIIDGENARKEILMCIHEATTNIGIRMYMWRDDIAGNMILRALEKKLLTHPHIQIYIEKDAFGSRVYNFQNFLTFGKRGGDIFSTRSGKDFLQKNNISFSLIGSWWPLRVKYLRENDHSKIFLFDVFTPKSRALIGGMNIADEYLNDQKPTSFYQGGWHDYMVKLTGEFADSILVGKGKKLKKLITKQAHSGLEIFMTIKNRFSMRRKILSELSRARTSITIEHGYLTDATIIRRLRAINRKGVQVRIILPDCSDGVYHANMHSIHKLLRPSIIPHRHKNTIEIFLYPGMIHAKVILIDESVAIIGSANLTYASFDFLHETNAIFRGRDGIVKDLGVQLQKDINSSTKITEKNIPSYSRLMAWFQAIFI